MLSEAFPDLNHLVKDNLFSDIRSRNCTVACLYRPVSLLKGLLAYGGVYFSLIEKLNGMRDVIKADDFDLTG